MNGIDTDYRHRTVLRIRRGSAYTTERSDKRSGYVSFNINNKFFLHIYERPSTIMSSSEKYSTQPGLSHLGITDSDTKNISLRKRKTPEDDLIRQFSDFKNEILGILKDFTKSQTESVNSIRNDISFIKEQLTDYRATTDRLISENNNIKLQIENLATNITDTQERVKTLETDLYALQSNQPASSLAKQCFSEYSDDIIREVQERLQRNKNIIISGITEPHMTDMTKKREADRSAVNNFLHTIHPTCPEPVKIIRLGKYDGQKLRLIKVCFASSETAKEILKNKLNLKDNKFKIYSDQTPIQYQTMLNLREELRNRTEKGESGLIIKYVKGNPKIVKEKPKN